MKNKLDENGEVTRNKARLVCKGYAQEARIDYGEKFVGISRLEGVRTFLFVFPIRDSKSIRWM